jgi:hypothetical protein
MVASFPADIVFRHGSQAYIWEVKSSGKADAAVEAASEARAYANAYNVQHVGEGVTAEPGPPLPGAIAVPLGGSTMIVYSAARQQDGAILYSNDPNYEPVPAKEPVRVPVTNPQPDPVPNQAPYAIPVPPALPLIIMVLVGAVVVVLSPVGE